MISRWLTAICLCLLPLLGRAEMLCSVLDRSDGLSDNNLRAMTRLPDGRMVFVTSGCMNIYDGSRFSYAELFPDSATIVLGGYTGHHRLLLDSDSLLWIKNRGKAVCFDLRTERYVPSAVSLPEKGVDDIFTDCSGNLWLRSGDRLTDRSGRRSILLPAADGALQDLMTDDKSLYLFFDTGRVAIYGLTDLRREGHRDAYPPSERPLYDKTSLTKTVDGGFYQLRNGARGGMFFFNTATRQWHDVMTTAYPLNTLAVTKSGRAYITCGKGIWVVDSLTAPARSIETIKTSAGNLLSTNISTVFEDAGGTLWLGTYNRGVLYAPHNDYISGSVALPGALRGKRGSFMEDFHGGVYLESGGKTYRILPGSALVETDGIEETRRTKFGDDHTFVAADGSVYFMEKDSVTIFTPRGNVAARETVVAPLLAGLWIHGEKVCPDSVFGGRVVLTRSLASVRAITLDHNQNYLTFEYHIPDYTRQRDLRLRYRLEGLERAYMDVPGTAGDGKTATLHYTALPPGHYRLSVEVSTNDEPALTASTSLDITILAPWWRTPAAYICYVVVAAALLYTAMRLYVRNVRRKMERRQREEILLVRIRSLIEQCERYESEKAQAKFAEAGPETAQEDTPEDAGDEEGYSANESTFIAKAIRLVEENLDTPGYSVEQLSRDLCMERTGLYKKLTSLLDQSPSLFMRNIRLRRVAELLETEPAMSIGEIAGRTGFSSSSYMSKCFQDAYGCRPSEYAASRRKST